MNNYGTEQLIAFATKLISEYSEISVSDKITNKDYEGEVKEKGQIVKIGQLGKFALRHYNGQYTNPDKAEESVKTLTVDQDYGFYFEFDDTDELKSMIKNPEGTVIESNSQVLKEYLDAYNLNIAWRKAKAGNRIGTAYTTGDITIDVSGNVTINNGGQWTAAMVGRGVKAVGHTEYYRIATVAGNGLTATIKKDLQNESIVTAGLDAYDGGALNGVAYTVEAATPVTLTKANIYTYFVYIKNILDKWKIPATGRWAVLPSDIANLFGISTELTHATSEGDSHIRDGRLPIKIAGFTLYQNEQVTYDSVTGGYHCPFGVSSAITHAMALTRQDTEPAIGRFGKVYKDLWIWGSDVPDERKKALAEGFFLPSFFA